ncbi:ribonuclease H-like domain-containing protein [Dendryphion nanum]|uniref:Ribonuclease H-like domain-containing protein n=1 Tax=Dendryphion nanum TaxID=256645 RepID=A0A9P9IV54_9PLEO|nr:ribonuclease H-like domain-containing protein [Dendryphion nanum]
MAQTQEIIAVAQNISENSDKDGSSKATDDETDIDKDIVDEVEEHIPLDFQIPPETLRAAMQALPNSAGSFWSQTLYRGPENQMILVHYSTTTELSERVAKYFLEEKVLGFDIEWKPQQRNSSIKDNVSLIQIACEDRIALFHIAQHMGTTSEELLPPSLKTIIESPDILKVGVAIKSDFSRIRKFMGINPRGVFEISRLHNQVEHFGTAQEISWKLTSLATQVQQHLLLPLFKGRTSNDPEDDEQSVRVSDWSLPLRKDQMEYAASDAYAGFRLFDTLEAKRKTLKPIPARPLVCDSDDGSRPRSKHSKPAAKVAVENPDMEEVQQAGDDVLEGMKQGQEQDVGSEEDAYATAAEELTDGEEADSESTSSGADSDPDADYVPTSRELRQLSLNLDLPVRPPHSTQQRPRRLGRLGPAMLTPSDMPVSISKVEYPKLPSFSSDEGHSSDSSDAFDPPIQRPKQQHSPKKATSLGSSFEEQVNTDPEDPEGRITFPNSQISQSNSDPYQLASTWASTYLKDTIPAPSFSRSSPPSRIRATLSPLRAYHMWHHQKLPLERIAELLREPPLALSTVCGYIVKATSMEKLEYENAAMKEVLKSLPVGLRRGRGRWMNTEMGD